jgi:hypothetical protein
VKLRASERADASTSKRKITHRPEKLELEHPQMVRERYEGWSSARREHEGSWREFDKYVAKELEFDLSTARAWFEATEPQPCLYDGVTPLAKVIAHLEREHCGECVRPPRRECVLARLLFGAYRAVERHRVGPDLTLFWQLVEEQRRRDMAQYAELVEMAERLRKKSAAQPDLAALQLERSLQPFAHAISESMSAADRALTETSFAPGRRPRKHERTIFVNLEAELLESGFFEESEVLEGIRDLRTSGSKATSGPLDRLRARRKSPAELIRVAVKPWVSD